MCSKSNQLYRCKFLMLFNIKVFKCVCFVYIGVYVMCVFNHVFPYFQDKRSQSWLVLTTVEIFM